MVQSGKRRGSSFLVAVALLAGVALGYCLAPGGTDAPASPGGGERLAKRPLADVGEAASVKSLRARIADLERQLAEARRPANEVEKVASQDGPRPPRGGGPREWMEDMRKNDPERYTQMTNRFEQFRRRRAERQRRNIDFLSSVDTSRMSAAARKTHVALQAAMARREELFNQVRETPQDPEAAAAERREVARQMRENEEELRRLRQEERYNLFEVTANTLGFEGDDAKEIVETLKEVVESTEGSWRHMGPPPGSPPPPRN